MSKPPVKPLEWVASSKKDLLSMPSEAVDVFGYALHLAQRGGKHPQAKPLKGFGSAGVLEVLDSRMTMAALTARFIPSDLIMQSMSCIVFRKSRRRGSKRPDGRWTWFVKD